ncbi:MAG TPA: hypothetical protein VFL95_00370 [Gemmatimonadales bacterium]|nr:hypothetical protein [Gemmatimonadales bacterium]
MLGRQHPGPGRPALLVVLALAGCAPVHPRSVQPARSGFAGRWDICLTAEARRSGPACGVLSATPDSVVRGFWTTRYFRLEQDAPLSDLLGRSGPVPRFGVAYPMGGGRWGIRLGVNAGVLDARDGDIWTDLIIDGDSAGGEWIEQRGDGSAARGRFTIRAAGPQPSRP